MAQAAKIVILEETPGIVNITALPTAVTGMVAVCERGDMATATLSTSWDEWVDQHGGYGANYDGAIAAYGFFLAGTAQQLWTVRTCHFTDLTDPTTAGSATGTYTIQNAGVTATVGAVTSSIAENYTLVAGDDLDIKIDGAGAVTTTFTATAGSETSTNGWPLGDQVGLTEKITIDGGTEQTITFGTATTAAHIVEDLNAPAPAGLSGASAAEVGGHVVITSDTQGSGSSVAIGTGTCAIVWAAAVAGTGNVIDISAVLGSEIVTAVDAAMTPDTLTTVSGGYVTISTVDTGVAAFIQVEGGTARTKIGFDNTIHYGVDAAPANTLTIDGKTPGVYTNTCRLVVSASSSTVASEFNFAVEKDGTVVETFRNVTMDDTATNFIETVVNNVNTGSLYVEVTDEDAGGTPTSDRPTNGTHGYMTGGNDGLTSLADTDFVGDSAGPTGLYALDIISTLRIAGIPARASTTVYSGLKTYCDTYRGQAVFGVYATPTLAAVATVAAMKTFVETTCSLVNSTEYGAIYCPRIKIANPSKSVYGQDDSISVDPSLWICGTMSRVDSAVIGGVYEAPAGVEQSMGVINGQLGLETDEVNDPTKREILCGVQCNPIRHHPKYGYYIDGHQNLKETGSWPSIPEVRGKIHIAQSIAESLEWVKHRRNTPRLQRRVTRSVTAFLMVELENNAFATDEAATAFFVQCDGKNNPPYVMAAGNLKCKVGLNFGTPIDVGSLIIAKDTRAYEESLAA